MRNIALYGLTLLLTSMFASQTLAASGFVDVGAYDVESGQGNFTYYPTPTTASVTYSNPQGGSAEAWASFTSSPTGALSMKVFATGTAGDFVSNRGQASLGWVDGVRTTGTLLDILIDLEYKFTGSKSGAALVEAALSACVDSHCNTHVATGPATFHITAADLISPNLESATISINLMASATGVAITGPSTSTADFSHSLDLVSITPRDVNGNFVPGVSFISESGFDYNALIVPEPTALALCALGMFVTIAQPRGRRRR